MPCRCIPTGPSAKAAGPSPLHLRKRGLGKISHLEAPAGTGCSARQKAFIYDIKGDFTSIFERPAIVCPFDKRSWIWDVGRDVATQTQAAAFSQSIIPGGGQRRILGVCGASLAGRVRARTPGHEGQELGWAELAALVARPAELMAKALSLYYPRAAALISNPDSNTTSSCIAVLANGTAVIERLALAWPERTPGQMFSMLDWIKDDYTGCKQVIVQSGPDEVLTKAYISAMINCAVPEIIGPSLPDDETGRFLGFFFDELTSTGKLNIEPLLALGRSKAWWPAWPCRIGHRSRGSMGTRPRKPFQGWSAHTLFAISKSARPGKSLPEPGQAHRGLADPRRKSNRPRGVESRCSAGAAH